MTATMLSLCVSVYIHMCDCMYMFVCVCGCYLSASASTTVSDRTKEAFHPIFLLASFRRSSSFFCWKELSRLNLALSSGAASFLRLARARCSRRPWKEEPSRESFACDAK